MKGHNIILHTLLFSIFFQLSNGNPTNSIKHNFPTPVMIEMEGYPAETHTVITDDCYILEMHRIPNGKSGKNKASLPPVLLLHGILGSSADWVMASAEKSLGFIMADAGYDVWLGNMRGNTYSRQHCQLSPDEDEFWQFSFDQVGEYDIPAMIDTIRSETGAEKIFYTGFSMGTTTFLAMANTRPEYQEYIHLASLLAPVAYVDNMISPLKYIAPFTDQVWWITEFLGLGEFLPSNSFIDWIAGFFCDEGILQGVCSNVIYILAGWDEAQVNTTLLETIFQHTPAGTSTNTLIQFGQEINSKNFCAFDYGNAEDNQAHYGQETPPDYDLTKVTVPVALYWSEADWLAQPADVIKILTKLPNIFANYEVPYEGWAHLDFTYGIDANKYVYEEVMKNMEKALP